MRRLQAESKWLEFVRGQALALRDNGESVALDEKTPEQQEASIRKASFREVARNIVFVDRQRRKTNQVVDTAGTIARALERAYLLGREDALAPGPAWVSAVGADDEASEWITIPPRARSALRSLALHVLGRDGLVERAGFYVPHRTERDTPGWILHWPGRTPNSSALEEAKSAISHKTIEILFRLGLVERGDTADETIVLSSRGRATWLRFHDVI